MPDLSAAYDIPNPFALFASDFAYDLAGYRAALGFLSDLAGGSDHDAALWENGANPAMLTAWKASDKFRRVYAKCHAAGEAEQKWTADHAADTKPDSDSASTEASEQGQRFIPLDEAPLPGGVFRIATNAASWGG